MVATLRLNSKKEAGGRANQIAIPPASFALTMLFLFLFLLFFFNTEQGIHVGLDCLQFLIFFPQPLVIFISGFFLCQQLCVLCLQNFYRGQLLHTLSVKGSLSRFIEKQICFVGSSESRFVCCFGSAVGSIGIPCFSVVDDMGFLICTLSSAQLNY